MSQPKTQATELRWVATDRLARQQVFRHRRYQPGQAIAPEDWNALSIRQRDVLTGGRFVEQRFLPVE